MSTENQDARVIEALRSLADEAVPSADLRARSLAPIAHGAARGRRPMLLVAASVAALALLAVGATLLLTPDEGPTVVADDDPRPGTSVEPAHGSVDAEALGRDLLVFGDDGIAWLVDGERRSVWSRPVVRAFPDGVGGVVFQERSEARSIVWLPAGEDAEPTTLVEANTDSFLHGVVERGGETTALFTRRTGQAGDEIQTLYGYALATGSERPIIETGGSQSGLDAVVAAPDGELLLSTCHLQCGISTERSRNAGEASPIVPPDWISGLDAEGDTLAYVRFTFVPEDGMVADPVLILAAANGEIRQEVPLGYDVDGAQDAIVDLAPDGEAAIIWFSRGDELADPPMIIDQLDQREPRVRVLSRAERVRFAPTSSAVEGSDDLDAATVVVQDFLAALEQGDLDAAARLLSEYARGVSSEPEVRAALEQFREDYDWLVSSSAVEWHTSRSFGFTPESELPIVTAVAPPSSEGQQRKAAAFLVGPVADGDELQIQRLPESLAQVTPAPGSVIRAGDRIVISGVPIEGGATAYVNGREVTAEVDYENLTTSIEIPAWADEDGEVLLILSRASPELPSAEAFWYRVVP